MVVRPIPAAVFAGEVAYVVALIELDEGVRMPSNPIDCEAGKIAGGLAVGVAFDDVTDEVTLTKFRPTRGAPSAPLTDP